MKSQNIWFDLFISHSLKLYKKSVFKCRVVLFAGTLESSCTYWPWNEQWKKCFWWCIWCIWCCCCCCCRWWCWCWQHFCIHSLLMYQFWQTCIVAWKTKFNRNYCKKGIRSKFTPLRKKIPLWLCARPWLTSWCFKREEVNVFVTIVS